MTTRRPYPRCTLAELVTEARSAGARLRRNDANSFQIATNAHAANAFHANCHIRTAVQTELYRRGLKDLSEAIYEEHEVLKKIAHINDWPDLKAGLPPLKDRLRELRKTVREACTADPMARLPYAPEFEINYELRPDIERRWLGPTGAVFIDRGGWLTRVGDDKLRRRGIRAVWFFNDPLIEITEGMPT